MAAIPAIGRAHARLRRIVLDPDYREPGGRDEPAGRAWLYAWGDCEAYLLARLRHAGMRDCQHVFHPGLFRGWSAYTAFARRFALKRVPRGASAEIVATGNARVVVNGRVLARGDATRGVRVDLAPALRAGDNDVKVLVTALDAPAALRWTSPLVDGGDGWSASRDDMHAEPAAVAREVDGAPPHAPRPRVLRLAPRRRGDGLYDLGIEAVGRFAVATRGRGAVAITPGESVAEAMARPPRDNPDALDEPITRARVSGARTTSTAPVAMRYARVDARGGARVVRATFVAECERATYRGAFACSDPLLERVWAASAYTLRLCVRDGLLIDGPKRDRMPWVGDAFLAALCGAYAFGDAGPVRRTLIALAPADARACHANGIVDYSLYWLLALEAHRLHADDAATVARLWPDALRIVDALAAQEDGDGFLRRRDADWLFIDWADLDKDGVVPALQWLYAWALRDAAATAAAVGDAPAARALGARRRRLVAAIEARLWDARAGIYAERGRRASRHAQFLAVLGGASPARRVPLARALRAAPASPAGLPAVGTPWMRTLELAALAALGDTDGALDGVRATWGGMLDAGATTFWEAWDATQRGDERYAFYGRPFAKSLCHAWAAGPAWLLPRAVLGITPLDAAWRRVAVRPARCALAWAHATVPTPRGALHVEWEHGRLRVRAPRGIVVVR